MSRSKSSSLVLGGVTLFLAAVLLFTGCSRTPLTADEPTVDQPQVLTRSAAFAASLVPGQLYTEAVVSSADGGRLVLYDVLLEVPPGAVANDTLFSINIPDVNSFYNEFGTSGLVFDVPVKVTMSYRGADLSNINESTIRIGYYDEATGEWDDLVCEVDFVNKLVTAELSHFSAYGLISD
ncbi:MAG: hypothetical protein KKA42_12300 [candidate division Zixibacteria bacterium]|nr:hypothetical protein [candidate division Zixibacteria bacterium]